MNYVRGLSRLWVVISIFWIFAAGYTEYQFFFSEKFIGLIKSDGNSIELCDPSEETVYRSGPIDPYDCLDRRNFSPDWSGRLVAGAFILLPPALLLLIGSIMVWVVRGFRKSVT